jgi:nucleotide-binding universal stress UspA family protein
VAGRIVVGVDGSAHARQALRFALAEAALRGARVVVVGSWAVPPLAATGVGMIPAFDLLRTELADSASEVLSRELAEVADAAAGAEVEQHVAQGDAAGVLVEAAAGADLLVVGSRGRGGLTGTVLGSVSRACLHHAPCPVAVVHDAGRPSGRGSSSASTARRGRARRWNGRSPRRGCATSASTRSARMTSRGGSPLWACRAQLPSQSSEPRSPRTPRERSSRSGDGARGRRRDG